MVDLMNKVGGVRWGDDVVRDIARLDKHGHLFGGKHKKDMIGWIDGLVKGEDSPMIDSFRLNHPNAEGRFTCWNQYTNRRYENEGARIDYILVDRGLKDRIEAPGTLGLSCGNEEVLPRMMESWGGDGGRTAFENTFEAATLAATFSGGFVPASFAGGGMTAPDRKSLNGQFDKNQSGIIYTPPTYSDHCGVVCYLRLKGVEVDEGKEQGGKSTKECQPHKAQKSLMGFFGGGGGGGRARGKEEDEPFCKHNGGRGGVQEQGWKWDLWGEKRRRGEGSKQEFVCNDKCSQKEETEQRSHASVRQVEEKVRVVVGYIYITGFAIFTFTSPIGFCISKPPSPWPSMFLVKVARNVLVSLFRPSSPAFLRLNIIFRMAGNVSRYNTSPTNAKQNIIHPLKPIKAMAKCP